jgi:putative oxidoreductase
MGARRLGHIDAGYGAYRQSVFLIDRAIGFDGQGQHCRPGDSCKPAATAGPLFTSKAKESPMPARELLETGRNLAERIPHSLVALLSRVAVANIFWRSGQTKVSGFSIREETFYLFREEYKVPLLPPDLAAYLATTAEHVFPILLVIGLATRLSALGLFGMTMVIQLFVVPGGWPEHLLWLALLVAIIARGPGAISLDHLIWNSSRLMPALARQNAKA